MTRLHLSSHTHSWSTKYSTDTQHSTCKTNPSNQNNKKKEVNYVQQKSEDFIICCEDTQQWETQQIPSLIDV